MNTQEILKFCFENGLLVDKDILNLFGESEDVEGVKILLNKIKNSTGQKIITKTILDKNKERVDNLMAILPEGSQKILQRLKIKLGLTIEVEKEIATEKANNLKEKSESEVKIISMEAVQSKKLEVSDFVNYFKGRLNDMKGILQNYPALNNLVSINKLSRERQNVSIIGLVYDKNTTKNKNLILELEDLTGRIKVLISKNKEELYEKAQDIPLDAVIGIQGNGDREILFANEIVFPDSRLPERKRSTCDENVLFIGDFHVGSRFFMEENFLRFVDYINGKNGNREEVEKIKYIFIIGDLIAGVGIFPGQEEELIIPDVEEQYAKAAELLGKIRKDIKIIISPGNHDALRIMEPQPVLDEKYAWAIYNLKNVILTGNPAQVNIGAVRGFSGFDILTYHGYSYHYYANNIPRLVMEKATHKPEDIMDYLLQFRHLAPTHSSTLYFPSERDPLFIKNIPDILVSAHTHKSAVSYHNNILLISTSSWEKLTPYQEKMGNEPDFCKVPMFNLKTRAVKILDFE